jgi:phenylpropionate dioxygenase-like ring-hydroxylating dioxygenase large terminal subunit
MTFASPRRCSDDLSTLLEDIRQAADSPADKALSLPPAAYTNRELLELEREAIFRRDWVAIGRVDEIAKPGDYMTAQIDHTPVLAARQKDGSIRVFANVCTHRAMELVEGRGSARRFTCRYHAWTFGLNGDLIAAPAMAEGFCKSGKGLTELRHEVALGFLFVSLNDNPTSLSERLAPLAERVSPYQVERMRTLRKDTLFWDCTWKVAVENGIEPYHITATHPQTLAPFAPVRNVDMEGTADGYHAYNHHYDDEQQAPQSPYYIPNTSGNNAIRKHAVAGCIYPNMAFSIALDWMWWITCQPVDTNKVRVDHGVCGPFDFKGEAPDLTDTDLFFLNVDTAFMPEDVPRVEGVQRGMESGFARQSELSPLEGTIHGFIQNYHKMLQSVV